jgi:hypothetical protein
MSWFDRFTRRAEEPTEMEAFDPTLTQALGDFKASVHAWSDAAYSRPRTAAQVVKHRTWQLAAGWSLASLLLAGTISGGVYEHHLQAEAQRVAAQQAAHQREIAAQQARDEAQQEEDMLASVDTAVSREVPSAMEPLAALMDETEAETR